MYDILSIFVLLKLNGTGSESFIYVDNDFKCTIFIIIPLVTPHHESYTRGLNFINLKLF